MPVIPSFLSLICCIVLLTYLLLASRKTFLPFFPSLFGKLSTNIHYCVFMGSVFIYFSLFAYAFYFTVAEMGYCAMHQLAESFAFHKYLVNNEAIETLLLHHQQLEEALIESNQSFVQAMEKNGQALQKKELPFIFWKHEIDDLLKADKDLARKTDPWFRQLEDIMKKIETSDNKTSFLVKSEEEVQGQEESVKTKSTASNTIASAKENNLENAKTSLLPKANEKKSFFAYFDFLGVQKKCRSGLDNVAVNMLAGARKSPETPAIDMAENFVTHAIGNDPDKRAIKGVSMIFPHSELPHHLPSPSKDPQIQILSFASQFEVCEHTQPLLKKYGMKKEIGENVECFCIDPRRCIGTYQQMKELKQEEYTPLVEKILGNYGPVLRLGSFEKYHCVAYQPYDHRFHLENIAFKEKMDRLEEGKIEISKPDSPRSPSTRFLQIPGTD